METEAIRPSCGLDQHCNGGGYRGDLGPEGRSLCEPGCRHRARRTLQKEAFPKVGQNMLQLTGAFAMASCPCQGLASALDLGQPSWISTTWTECCSEVRVGFRLLCSSLAGTSSTQESHM